LAIAFVRFFPMLSHSLPHNTLDYASGSSAFPVQSK
jgi:hypothetical protein